MSFGRNGAAAILGLVLGAVIAVLVTELLHLPLLWPGLGRWLVGASISGVAGAAQGWLWARRGHAPQRRAVLGAAVGFVSAALLVHAPLPWTDLSVFGAGPAGALAVVLFPLATAAAGLVSPVNSVRGASS